MFNLKRKTRRARDALEDLSMVALNPSLAARQCQLGSHIKRPRLNFTPAESENLKEQLIGAREQAIKHSLNIRNGSATLNSLKQINLNYSVKSKGIGGSSGPPGTSSQKQAPQIRALNNWTPSGITIKSVPTLINTSQTRAAISQKKVLQPIQTNYTQQPKGSETEYWSQFTTSGKTFRARGNKGLNPMTHVTQSQSVNKSSWTASCGFPIKRADVSLVQTEVASLANCNSTPRASNQNSSASGYERKGDHLLPWLCRSVHPPPEFGAPSLPVESSQGPVNGNVMQGKWVGREQSRTSQISKKYSIAELADILCGEVVSNDPVLTSQISDPFPQRQSEAATVRNIQCAPITTPGILNFTETCFKFESGLNNDDAGDGKSMYFWGNPKVNNLGKKKRVSFVNSNEDSDIFNRSINLFDFN